MSIRIVLVCVLLVSGTALIASTQYPVYSVASWTDDAQLLWSADEAYLFIGNARLGWRRGLAGLARDGLLDMIGIGLSPGSATDTLKLESIVSFGAAGVETRTVRVVYPGMHYLFDGRIHSQTERGGFVRWTGAKGEPVTGVDEQRLQGMLRVKSNFDNDNGWSGRSNVLSQPYGSSEFVVHVAGIQWKVIARNHWFPDRWQAIDLQRTGEGPQRVWTLQMDYKSSVSEQRVRQVPEPVASLLRSRRGR